MEETMNPNAVGFCWFNAASCICVTIWWNPGGYTGQVDEKGQPIFGTMQASINAVPGRSQEEDINKTCDWGADFPLHIAVQLIDQYGGWIQPQKLNWRPKPETNSPLKLKLKYKGSEKKPTYEVSCHKCGNPTSPGLHSCPYACEINDDHSESCNCCENCTHECAMDV